MRDPVSITYTFELPVLAITQSHAQTGYPSAEGNPQVSALLTYPVTAG
jgi:hypothetical protein